MTKHSSLTNPVNLHFSKFKEFTGNPANFKPDFVGQIVVSTDTNNIYRATGSNFGQVVLLTEAKPVLPYLPTVYHWHDNSIVVTGNAINNRHSTTQRYATFSEQFPAALNDCFKFSVYLEAKTYTVLILGATTTDCGQTTCFISGVQQFSLLDFYTATSTANTVFVRSLTISDPGLTTLEFKTTGKNASSTGYKIKITSIIMQ